jgi:hypothetical protein
LKAIPDIVVIGFGMKLVVTPETVEKGTVE